MTPPSSFASRARNRASHSCCVSSLSHPPTSSRECHDRSCAVPPSGTGRRETGPFASSTDGRVSGGPSSATECSSKCAGLVSHELDMAGISPSMAEIAGADPALRVVDYPVLVAYGLVFNASRPPFDDARVRRAIAAAIDRDRIIDAALAGFATPATGPVSPDHPFSLKEAPRRDVVMAGVLLDSAGWLRGRDGARARDGTPLTFELLTVGSADNAAEQLIQADLAALGIRLEIRQREMGAFLAEA